MNRKCAAILLSRQHSHPCMTTPWVRAAKTGLEWIKANNFTLITSVGMQTWELLLYYASELSIPTSIVIPASDDENYKNQCTFIEHQFSLDSSLLKWVMLKCPNTSDTLQKRDKYIINAADILIPVCVRNGGVMSGLITSSSEKEINTSFSIPYKAYKAQQKQDYAKLALNPEIERKTEEYLFHWTRASNEKWPDETYASFYKEITRSDVYPRDAFRTLDNIVKKRLIIGSSRHMPENNKCVSFTSKSPSEFISHMRWRTRYSEMSFEPYGIGIRFETAKDADIKEVLYYSGKLLCASKDVWLSQSAGKKGDWKSEQEYRFQGDFDFSGINNRDIFVVCKSQYEAALIQSKYSIVAIPMFL